MRLVEGLTQSSGGHLLPSWELGLGSLAEAARSSGLRREVWVLGVDGMDLTRAA